MDDSLTDGPGDFLPSVFLYANVFICFSLKRPRYLHEDGVAVFRAK
ncbi:hypothetical protein HQN87_00100 [Paenibacillus tritici]|uniref:Uncharacterized protein n=1 Tax=Paenibacillus tritici TaxID=1873425 RepID=A0ABX2DGT3_9BACL|nr:hypothetical protein [Paenibacillus tritici]NQX43715.1 hypothetical protein [Paenibacillus tritici]